MKKDFPQALLICPKCHSKKLRFYSDYFTCQKCKEKYLKIGNKYVFNQYLKENIADPLDKIKHKIKAFEKIYQIGIYVFSPIFYFIGISKFLKKYTKHGKVTINLGSGNSNLSENVYNVDIFSYENTDIVCDIENLPFADSSIDNIINIATLEHVPYPEKVVREIYRVLKPKGVVFSHFPFICGFHASPYDYSRRTAEGLRYLYKEFEIVSLKPASGPTSAFLWIFQEWLAIILSFGIKPLYRLLYFLIMLLTFPVKFLDAIFIFYPGAKNISFAFTFIGKKDVKK